MFRKPQGPSTSQISPKTETKPRLQDVRYLKVY